MAGSKTPGGAWYLYWRAFFDLPLAENFKVWQNAADERAKVNCPWSI
jgi:hypothetical protein